MNISRVKEMRDLDRTAVQKYGITSDLLMENAGNAAFHAIFNEFGVRGLRFLVLCGIGNNGGDGLVVSRKLHSARADVKVRLLGDPKKFKGPAEINFQIAQRLGLSVERISSLDELRLDMAQSDVLIDAVFGTGLARTVEGRYKDIIEAMNNSGAPIAALDIPSGINGDTGQIMGCAVLANCTVTFGLPKPGNLLYPGFSRCGKIYVTSISFPPEMMKKKNLQIATNDPQPLPERNPDGHKGSFGDVLFIAGAVGYFGAPYFSALSFLKAGGGYSRLAAPVSVVPAIAAKGSEIVYAPQVETAEGSLALSSRKKLIRLAEKTDMAVIGPGLSLHTETQQLVRDLIRTIAKPVLVDGDGITAVSQDLSCISSRKFPTVLTPHLGEMARMTGKTIREIQTDRIHIVRKLAEELGAILVLKGAHSLIGFPEGQVFVNLSGNAGMATAGSGDVLSGVIAAMFGLGIPLNQAVQTGVFLHGFSGDIAAAEKGEDGMTAQDILDTLPDALRYYRNNFSEILSDSYQTLFEI